MWPHVGHIMSWTSGSSQGLAKQGCGEVVYLVYLRTGSSLGTVLAGLIPTNAHPDIGFARVILSERGHSISLVNIKADLQAPRLLQQPEDKVRNLRDSAAPPFLSMPPFPSPSSRKQPVQGK